MSALDNLQKQIEIETPAPLPLPEQHEAITREEIAKMVEDSIKDLKPDLQELVKDLIAKNTSVKEDPLPAIDKEEAKKETHEKEGE